MTHAHDAHAPQPGSGISRRDLMALAGAIPLAGTAWAQGAAPTRGGVLKVSANANPSSLDHPLMKTGLAPYLPPWPVPEDALLAQVTAKALREFPALGGLL